MIECGGGAGFANQTLASIGGSCLRHYFDCDFAHQLEVRGAIDDAHSAPTDFAVEPVALAQYNPRCNGAGLGFIPGQDASCLGIIHH